MKQFLSLILLCTCGLQMKAQITLNVTDAPNAGDTVRFSHISANGANVDYNTTGPNTIWDFSNLTPASQTLDTYRLAGSVNAAFASANPAYGVKVADTLNTGGAVPFSITDVYGFFQKKTNPDRFELAHIGVSLGGNPQLITYSDPDEFFLFPKSFGNHDSTTFKFDKNLGFIGSIHGKGTRVTDVDGFGTIITPYYTTPVQVLRIKSVTRERDSINITAQPPVAFDRNTVDYQYIPVGVRIPALWITTFLDANNNQTLSSVRYHDMKRNLTSIGETRNLLPVILKVYPNPAIGNSLTVEVPSYWKNVSYKIYDAQGKTTSVLAEGNQINISSLASGNYIILATEGNEYAVSTFTK